MSCLLWRVWYPNEPMEGAAERARQPYRIEHSDRNDDFLMTWLVDPSKAPLEQNYLACEMYAKLVNFGSRQSPNAGISQMTSALLVRRCACKYCYLKGMHACSYTLTLSNLACIEKDRHWSRSQSFSFRSLKLSSSGISVRRSLQGSSRDPGEITFFTTRLIASFGKVWSCK